GTVGHLEAGTQGAEGTLITQAIELDLVGVGQVHLAATAGIHGAARPGLDLVKLAIVEAQIALGPVRRPVDLDAEVVIDVVRVVLMTGAARTAEHARHVATAGGAAVEDIERRKIGAALGEAVGPE